MPCPLSPSSERHAVSLMMALAALAFAYFMQFARGLLPCPLCHLQRWALMAVAAVALCALLHRPRTWGVRVYGLLGALFALSGAAAASRQTYLQHHPLIKAACVPGLDFLWQADSPWHAVKRLFAGGADCATVHWHALGLTMPEWSLLCFVLLTLFMLLTVFHAIPRGNAGSGN